MIPSSHPGGVFGILVHVFVLSGPFSADNGGHPGLYPDSGTNVAFSARWLDEFSIFCIQVMEVEAFCGVHDMIHAAILSHGSQASLREVINPTKILCPNTRSSCPETKGSKPQHLYKRSIC